ncbi:hypothetical protein [Pseudonocardia acaciae]|uniref:hypothetical protein n=1 Tax=Pseudonocardia acaciae TaxID=551276 RepID=UPI00048B40B3|nr:hypothetical protein [Pseudonocardia acaciae]
MNEITELTTHLASWQALSGFFGVVVLFGFLPGLTLRLLVKLYPPGHVRRRQLPADMYELPRHRRWFFVAEQLETVLFEGLPARVRHTGARTGRFHLTAWSVLWTTGTIAIAGFAYVQTKAPPWTLIAFVAGSALLVAAGRAMPSVEPRHRSVTLGRHVGEQHGPLDVSGPTRAKQVERVPAYVRHTRHPRLLTARSLLLIVIALAIFTATYVQADAQAHVSPWVLFAVPPCFVLLIAAGRATTPPE